MAVEPDTRPQLEAEIRQLRQQLHDAHATLDAIRRGHTDAVLVEGPEGPKVYLLEGADRPYRIMVEEMQEGALAFREDGLISYGNKQIARMLRTSHQGLLGKCFQSFLSPASLPLFEAILRDCRGEGSRGEIALVAADGTRVPALLALRLLSDDPPRLISAVLTDLTEHKRHQELIASEAFSSSILDQTTDAVVVCDDSGCVIRANQAAHRLCGSNPLRRPFHSAFRLYHPAQPHHAQSAAQLQDRELSLFPLPSAFEFPRGVEAALLLPDGGRLDLLFSAGPLSASDGTTCGCIVTVTDISPLRKVEEALRQSEDRFRLAIKATNDAIWDIDLATGVVQWNETYHRVFGRPPETADSWQWWIEHIHADDRHRAAGGLRAAVDGGESTWTCEYRFLRADGTWADVYDRAYIARDTTGKAWRVVGAMLDQTQRKRADVEILRLNQDLHRRIVDLQTVLQTVPAGVAIAEDPLGHHIHGNPANERMLGLPPGGELSKAGPNPARYRCFLEGRELAASELPMQRAIRGETVIGQVLDVLREDGQAVTLYSSAAPLLDEAGKPRGAVGAFLDVTPLKRAQDDLRQSRQRLAWVLDTAGVGLWLNKLPLAGLNWDKWTRELFFIPPDVEPTIDLFWQRIHPDDREATRLAVENAIRDHALYAIDHRAVNPQSGEIHWIRSLGKATYADDGTPVQFDGINYDITQRKQAEEALQQSEERLRLAQTGANVGVWDWNLQTGDQNWSPELNALYGLEPGTIVKYEDWRPRVHVDDVDRIEAERDSAIAARRPFDIEFRILHSTGQIRWINSKGSAVYNQAGEVTRILGINVDITQRKQAEEALREAKEAAEAADRAKTEFLANMSHEIRTPMAAILGFTDLLLDRGTTEEERREYVQTINENGHVLLQLINDILDLSKIEAEKIVIQTTPCCPKLLVGEVIGLLRVRADEKHVLLKAIHYPDLPSLISTDPVRLKQILVNLVGNAIKFTDRGSVLVETRCADADGSAPRLQFTVADTGVGIPADALPRIFDAFTQADTSHSRRFGGTGLGLTISQRLAQRLGGKIEVTSQPGKGSSFTLSIPLVALGDSTGLQDTHGPPKSFPAATGLPKLEGRVLLAEDSKAGAHLIQVLLARAGLQVEIAETGLAAVRMAQQSLAESRPYDLLLLDIQMPELDGFETATRLRNQQWPGPIISLTAHAMAGDRERCLAAGCDDYLSKPIDRENLLSLLSRYLQK